MAIHRDGRAFALGVVGAAALLATMAGEYLMHNPAQAQDILHCTNSHCLDNQTGAFGQVPYRATSVILLNGSAFNITLYQVIVLALGALVFVGAIVCALRTTEARRLVLAVAAMLLALTLVLFRTQPPLLQTIPPGGCDALCRTHPTLLPYEQRYPGFPAAPPLIDSVWFMAPAAVLGLLTAGIALLPVSRPVASKIAPTLPRDAGSSPPNRGR